jgi:hypothetical protein
MIGKLVIGKLFICVLMTACLVTWENLAVVGGQ